MTSTDLYALAGAGVITAGFAVARFAEMAFVLPSLAVIAIAAILTLQAPLAEAVLLVGGLSLYFVGLSIVRVMLHRSVSLRMLETYERGGAGDGGCEDIRGRLADSERYRLAAKRGESYELTAFGRAVADTVAMLYRVTNVEG